MRTGCLAPPAFDARGRKYLHKRLTPIVRDDQIEQVFYPILPPNTHAQQVLDGFTRRAAR